MSIPYGRQSIDESDIAAVVETLTTDWLTMGPKVTGFESAIAALAVTPGAVRSRRERRHCTALTPALASAPGTK